MQTRQHERRWGAGGKEGLPYIVEFGRPRTDWTKQGSMESSVGNQAGSTSGGRGQGALTPDLGLVEFDGTRSCLNPQGQLVVGACKRGVGGWVGGALG